MVKINRPRSPAIDKLLDAAPSPDAAAPVAREAPDEPASRPEPEVVVPQISQAARREAAAWCRARIAQIRQQLDAGDLAPLGIADRRRTNAQLETLHELAESFDPQPSIKRRIGGHDQAQAVAALQAQLTALQAELARRQPADPAPTFPEDDHDLA